MFPFINFKSMHYFCLVLKEQNIKIFLQDQIKKIITVKCNNSKLSSLKVNLCFELDTSKFLTTILDRLQPLPHLSSFYLSFLSLKIILIFANKTNTWHISTFINFQHFSRIFALPFVLQTIALELGIKLQVK